MGQEQEIIQIPRHQVFSPRTFEMLLDLWRNSAEKPEPSPTSVEVINNENIELGKGRRATVQVEKEKLEQYVSSKLVAPVADDFPTRWTYSFDARPRPPAGSSQSEEFEHTIGFTRLADAHVFINVFGIWSYLHDSQENTAEGLLEEICKTIAHETKHIGLFSNRETREEQIANDGYKRYWFAAGYTLPIAIGMFGGLAPMYIVKNTIKRPNKQRGALNRREFFLASGLMLAGCAGGSLFSKDFGWDAMGFYAQYVDPTHKLCYEEEKNWRELQGIISLQFS